MNEVIELIKKNIDDLLVDFGKSTNNKAAARRARKYTLSLESLMKRFRKESVNW